MRQVSPISCLLPYFLLLLALPAPAQQGSGNTLSEELRAIEMAIRRFPQDGERRLERAEFMLRTGRYDLARRDFSHAARLFPQKDLFTAMCWYKQGLCDYLLGNFAAAEWSFTRSIHLAPESPHPWYFRGKLRLFLLQKTEEGQADLRQSLALSDKSSVQVFHATYLLGEMEEALRIHSELSWIAKSESDREASAGLSYQFAALVAMIGEEREAVRLLGVALQEGYADFAWLEHDPSFMPIANGEWFRQFQRQHQLNYRHRQHPPLLTLGQEQGRDSYSSTQVYRDAGPGRGDLQWGTPALIDGDGDAQLAAGERALLRVPLIHAGIDATRFSVNLAAAAPMQNGVTLRRLDQRTTIAPGDTLLLEWELIGQDHLPEGQLRLDLSLQPAQGWSPGNLEILLSTLPFAPLSIEIPDHHFASEYGGNMEPGVPVLLRFVVQNTGQRSADRLMLDIGMPEGVFSAGGTRYDIGTLEAGQSEVLEFEFFTKRQYAAPSVVLDMQLSAQGGSWKQRNELSVRMNSPLEVTQQVVIRAKPRQLSPNDIRLTSSVDQQLPRTRMSRPGAIAVVIGNRDYAHPDVPVVDFALKDAASMRRYLIESMGFSDENVLFLTNATQADFHGLFGTKSDHKARLYNLVQPGETDVFLFYSGHGAPDPETQTGYFLPVDCDPTLVRFNGYSLETFYQNLGKIPYRTLTVAVDACFSGSSEQGSLIKQASPVRIKTDNPVLRDPNAWVMTAGTSDQIASWHSQEQHGLFTYTLLKALQGAADENQDRVLDYAELRRYLTREVPQQARRLHNRYQTPDIYGRDDLELIRYE